MSNYVLWDELKPLFEERLLYIITHNITFAEDWISTLPPQLCQFIQEGRRSAYMYVRIVVNPIQMRSVIGFNYILLGYTEQYKDEMELLILYRGANDMTPLINFLTEV